jgi:hypothetical protein
MESDPESAPNSPPRGRPELVEADLRARRQLRGVLLTLALLDTGVVLLVIGLAEARGLLGLTTPELLLTILGGVSLILAIRVFLAVRLRRRSGDLR